MLVHFPAVIVLAIDNDMNSHDLPLKILWLLFSSEVIYQEVCAGAQLGFGGLDVIHLIFSSRTVIIDLSARVVTAPGHLDHSACFFTADSLNHTVMKAHKLLSFSLCIPDTVYCMPCLAPRRILLLSQPTS